MTSDNKALYIVFVSTGESPAQRRDTFIIALTLEALTLGTIISISKATARAQAGPGFE
jgi:hypothetical protein